MSTGAERSVASDVVAELMRTPAGRRALSVQSPVFFDTYYCGMRYAPHREAWLSLFDTEVLGCIERKQKRKLLLLAPRDHGKTEACVTFALRQLCMDRNKRILWICEAEGQAKKRIRRVKALMNSARIREDWCNDPDGGFGPWLVTEQDKWSDKEVYVHRTTMAVDPSLEAVGSGGAITGGHFDVIMCDDLEDEKTTYSADRRKKTRDWFRGTVWPMLVRTGAMIIVGTRKHHDDLYGHFLNDPTCVISEDKAIKIWPEKHSFIYEEQRGKQIAVDVVIRGPSECLWHERPIKYLLLERLTVTPRIFSREYQNEVQDDSAAAFKWEWLTDAKTRGIALSLYQIPRGPDSKPVEGLDIVQGWDLALVTDPERAENRDTDFTVGVTWARDTAGNRYLLGINRQRGISEANLRKTVNDEYHKVAVACEAAGVAPPRVVSVERNAFGELHFIGLQRTTDLPLKAHLTTGPKKADPWEGVPSLSALFENGKVVFPSATLEDQDRVDPMVQELWGLGREKHDDCPMALWIAEVQLRKAGFVHVIAFGDSDDQTMASEADERAIPGDLLDDGTVWDGAGENPRKRVQEAGETRPAFWDSLNVDGIGEDW